MELNEQPSPELPVADLPSAWPAPPPAPEPKHNIFFGRFGLRAGYGMAIFILIFMVLTAVGGIFAVTATHHMHDMMNARMYAKAHPQAPKVQVTLPFSPRLITVADGVEFVGMLIMCWAFSKAERRRMAAYGIGTSRWHDLLPGLFWGVLVMSILVAVLHSMHLLIFDSRALYGPAIYIYGAKWLVGFLFVGFAEEYSFRGYVQYTFMRGLWGLAEKISPAKPRAAAFWMAAGLLSALFAFVHTFNPGETPIGILQVFLAGITLAYGLWRTGSLWWSIGMHMGWDWTQSFLFGVADSGNVSIGRLFVTHPAGNPILSGGADGPEGSLIGVLALATLCVIIHFTTRPGTQPSLERDPPPDWDFNAAHRPTA